jgi:4-amino-4-deoxy-L-arabinose transferase-like glycosyltransferase
VGLGLGAFVLYAFTGARYPATGDTPELMTVAKIFGVAHAPGYPLLTLTAHFFGLLPIGPYALRMSLYAATCSSACVGVVYSTVRRLTPQRACAVGAAVALALTPVFWQWSVVFEVFALANLLAATVAYLLVRWYLQPRRHGFLVGAAFTFGLALTNQQVILFVVPAIGYVLIARRAELLQAPRVIGYGALALIAGLLPYVYVPIAAARFPALNWADAQTPGNFYDLVTRVGYGSKFKLIGGGALAGGNPAVRFVYLLIATGFVLGILAAIGLVYAYRRQRWYFWFTVIAFAATGALFQFPANIKLDPVNSGLFVLERFFLLPIVLIAPLAGLGIAQIGASVTVRTGRSARLTRLVAVVAIAGAIVIAGHNYSRIDLSSDRIAQQYAVDLLDGLPRNDVLVANGDETLGPLWYVQQVEHVRPDVFIVLSAGVPVPWYETEMRAAGLSVPEHATMLSFREANMSRPFDFAGSVNDDGSLNGKFYVYPNGLTKNLLAEAINKSTDQLIADNTAKLATYHVPASHGLKSRSFDPTIRSDYAGVPYSVGLSLHQSGDNSQALTWYQKALAIDPGNSIIKNAIKDLTK